MSRFDPVRIEIGYDWVAIRLDGTEAQGSWWRNCRHGAKPEEAVEQAKRIVKALWPNRPVTIDDRRNP